MGRGTLVTGLVHLIVKFIMMSDDLKDTFDGYLMFDFSNFHGLMA